MKVKRAPRPLTFRLRLALTAVAAVVSFLLVLVPLCRLSSDLLVHDYPVLRLKSVLPFHQRAGYWAARAERETAVRYFLIAAGVISIASAGSVLFRTHPLRVRLPAARQQTTSSARLAKALNDSGD